MSPHGDDLYYRSRFASFAQCGDDRFLLANTQSGRSAHVSELVVRLWLGLEDGESNSREQLLEQLERSMATITCEPVDDEVRRQIAAVLQQLVTIGVIAKAEDTHGYDSVAEDYDARPTPLNDVIERLVHHTDEQHRRGVVLEVGCGTGSVLEQLAAFEPSMLHGLELSRLMLEHARRRLGDNPAIKLQQAAAELLPIDDQSVDLLVVATALHWFDQPAFWQEVRRVMSADHRIIVWNSVLDSTSKNPLTDFFGQGMSASDVAASLHADSLSLLAQLPPWIGVRSVERFGFCEIYRDGTQLEQVVRSWCPPDEVERLAPVDPGQVDVWPLEIPFQMSFAVLELVPN